MPYINGGNDSNCCSTSPFVLALKFSPVRGKIKRPRGQGCLGCVHQPYCQDFYWLRRNLEYSLTSDFGTSCGSWSNNKADYVHGATCGDLQLIDRWKYSGLQGEKDENGLGNPN